LKKEDQPDLVHPDGHLVDGVCDLGYSRPEAPLLGSQLGQLLIGRGDLGRRQDRDQDRPDGADPAYPETPVDPKKLPKPAAEPSISMLVHRLRSGRQKRSRSDLLGGACRLVLLEPALPRSRSYGPVDI